MAVYPNIVTTRAGWELVSRSNAEGKGILFTRIVLGNGDMDMNGDVINLTGVVSPKMELTITQKQNLHDGVFTVVGVLDNVRLENGFHLKEVGVYAKLEDDNTEVLFAYTNGGNYVDYIANKTRPTQQEFEIMFKVGNASNMDIIVPNDVVVTKRELLEHDNDPTAHATIINAVKQESGRNLSAHINDTQAHKRLFDALKDDTQQKLSRLQSTLNFVPTSGGSFTSQFNLPNLLSSTQRSGDNSKKVATTEFVSSAIQALDVLTQLDTRTLSSLGVRYSIQEKGYICFGKLFGGLIIQWGTINVPSNLPRETRSSWSFPIAFPKKVFMATYSVLNESANIYMNQTVQPITQSLTRGDFLVQATSSDGVNVSKVYGFVLGL